MANITEALQLAVRHHGAGQLQQAEQIYRQILQAAPQYAPALHLLGVLAYQAGDRTAAVNLIQQAIAQEPSQVPYHADLAQSLRALGQKQEVVECFRTIARLRPDDPDAHNELGIALAEAGQLEEAAQCFEKIMQMRTDVVGLHNNLGSIRREQGKFDEAAKHFERVLESQPDSATAHCNLGNVLKDQGRPDEAIECYQKAILLERNLVEAHYNLGVTYSQQKRFDDAVAACREAIQLRPDHAQAHHSLGEVFRIQGRWAEADQEFRTALRYQPNYAEVYNNLAALLYDNGQFTDALASVNECLRLRPDSAEAHYNRAWIYFQQGRLADAWPEFAWRLKCQGYATRDFQQPLWDGSPLNGQTLLVHAEQGYGDTMHFIRYVAKTRQLGGKVMVEVHPNMIPLLTCSGYEGLLAFGSELPSFDVHAPLLSLPGLFQTTLENLPADVPYLTADPALVEQWQGKLAGKDGLKVGIHWQGNPQYVRDVERSIPLAEFLPLAGIAGVRLISLQRYPGSEQIAALANRLVIEELEPGSDQEHGSFMDTAAVIKNLDLVITSDTATAHLAGALGVPVWLALNFVPDWRWTLGKETSAWYPTMRLFRQTRRGDWPDVFRRITQELIRLVAKSQV